MIYDSSEAIQLLVLGICFALALARALRARKIVWTEVACFFACMFLGNVYWYAYLAVFGDSPDISYIPDLNWIAGYIFLLMLMIECDHGRRLTALVPAAWIPVAACALCCAYYICVNGHPLSNLAYDGLVAALGFFAVRGLAARPDGKSGKSFAYNRFLHGAVLAFVAVEQAVWMSSLLDPTADFAVYGIVNYLLTFSYAAILAAAWRSDEL